MGLNPTNLSVHGGRGWCPGDAPAVNADVNNVFYPPSPKVVAVIRELAAAVNHLPDPRCERLRSKIAALHRVDAQSIEVGNGSSELLQVILTGLVGRGEGATIFDPTYGEYERCLEYAGAQITKVRFPEGRSFESSPDLILSGVDASTRMVVLCNPNNPTGRVMSRTDILEVMRRVGAGVWVVVDEAYIEFSLAESLVADTTEWPNLFVVRTFSKAYALSGLRIGYVVMGEGAGEAFARLVRTPWPVGILAMTAAEAALDDADYVRDMLDAMRNLKDEFARGINGLGPFEALPSETNFFLVDSSRSGLTGSDLCRLLEKQRIFVRDCTSFGDSLRERFVRLTTRSREENLRVTDALGAALRTRRLAS
jgi:histidinol-phosphate aminotransferase